MSDSTPDKKPAPNQTPAASPHAASPDCDHATDVATSRRQRKEARRWWIKLFVQPVLLLACGAVP